MLEGYAVASRPLSPPAGRPKKADWNAICVPEDVMPQRSFPTARTASLLLTCALLGACGGGGGDPADDVSSTRTTASSSTSRPTTSTTSADAPVEQAGGATDVSIPDPETFETVPAGVADPGPNPTLYDPGPNPTTHDPGPNDTSGGPRTVAGELSLDAASGCIRLQTPEGALHLRFTAGDFALAPGGGQPALVDVDGNAIAKPGDEVFVAGYPGGGTTACGREFEVESLVSVYPR